MTVDELLKILNTVKEQLGGSIVVEVAEPAFDRREPYPEMEGEKLLL